MQSWQSRNFKTTQSNNLDLLRAVAVLCVFISHLLAALGIDDVGSLGRFGVILFFVHTSLVLMESLQRLDVSNPSNRLLVATFWLRRIFRIYPLAILVVLAVAVFRIPPNPGMVYTWIGIKGLLANVALIQNLSYSTDILAPLWSLPLEVQMYGLLPFAYLIVRGGNGYRSATLWAFTVPLAIILPRLSGRLNVFLYAPCFASGVVAFELLRKRPQAARKFPFWLWPAGIVAAILLFGPRDNISLDQKVYRAWLLSLALGLLYVNVDEGSHNAVQRLFRWIAVHSYGIYLSHIVLIWFVLDKMPAAPIWARSLVLSVSVVTVPFLLHRFIEQPLTSVGIRLSHLLLESQVHVEELRSRRLAGRPHVFNDRWKSTRPLTESRT